MLSKKKNYPPQNHKFGLPLRPNLDSTYMLFIFVFYVILCFFLLKKEALFWFFFLEKRTLHHTYLIYSHPIYFTSASGTFTEPSGCW